MESGEHNMPTPPGIDKRPAGPGKRKTPPGVIGGDPRAEHIAGKGAGQLDSGRSTKYAR